MSFTRSRKHEIVLDCVNQSTVVPQAEFLRYLSAQQAQLDVEVAGIWDLTCKLACSQVEVVPASSWQFVLLDDSDQAGALGYHDDVVGVNGQPLAKAFAKTDLQNGFNWTVTASHEVIETLVDPDINRVVLVQVRPSPQNPSGLLLVAYEACDAVEADHFARPGKYRIQLSDFVTREWFEPETPGEPGKFSAYGNLGRPLEIAPGGYIGVFVPGRGWTQQVVFGLAPETRPMTRHTPLKDSPRRQHRFTSTP